MSWDMYPDSAVEYLLEKGPPGPDWAILEEPEVEDVIAAAAQRVFRQYPQGLPLEDLIQEGRILAATKEEARRTLNTGLGAFHQFVWRRLTDLVRGPGKRNERHVSREALIEDYMRDDAHV